MAAHNKRLHVAASSNPESSTDPINTIKKAKRRVSLATFDKWKRQFDDQHQTLRWLRCDKDTTDHTVIALWCEVCRKYSGQIRSMRNFSTAWVNGSTNHRNSNIVDHAKSEQHIAAMAHLQADESGELADEKVVLVVENAAFLASFPVMSGGEMEKMKRKFQICYMMAKEGIPFTKYTSLHNLQELHGVDLGSSYKTNDCAQAFIHYIAKSQRQLFLNIFAEKHFFSFMLHHATSVESKSGVVFVQYMAKDDVAKEINCFCRYLNVLNLTEMYDAAEMVTCLGVSLNWLGSGILSQDKISNAANGPTLVGGGSDRANNEDDQCVKAEMQSTFPWLFWSWCFSRQLERACKEAFTSSLYVEINSLLIHLYSLYNKSPQRAHQFASIVEDLKEVFHFSNAGNSLPVHNQGTRWINYKRRALQRIVDRFGVYCAHLYSMTEDPSLESADRDKLKSFYQQWTQGRILIGFAMYIDVLKVPSLLSLSLQENESDVVSGIKHLLTAMQTLRTLRQQEDTQEWPTVTAVLATITEEEDSKLYQGVHLMGFTNSTVSQCSAKTIADLHGLDSKLRDWLVAWSDAKLLNAILSFLDTRCWGTLRVTVSTTVGENTTVVDGEHDVEEAAAKSKPSHSKRFTEIKAAVAYIVNVFREPLEAKGADLCSINDELEEMFSFCTNYVDVLAEDYKKIWYKLFTAHDSQKWCNVLLISELLFSLPFANTKLEQGVSTLNRIRTEHHSLSSNVLDELMEINVGGPSTELFVADHAIHLWWTGHSQRPTEESSVDNASSENVHDLNNDDTEFSLSDWNDVAETT